MLSIKPMEPRGRSLISIGYKYNAQKVIYFIVTYNTALTHAVLTYLPKYPDQFQYVSIIPVAEPLGMYNLTLSVNNIYSQNKSNPSYMALEKFWFTQCCWI